MSTNLVSSISQILTSNIVDRVAATLGIDRTRVEAAMKGGVPALLAALTSLVSTQRGATALNSAIAQQQPGLLSNLTGMIGGTGQKSFIDAGSNALTSLLGGSTMSALTNALGGYAGIGESGTKGILGLLGPVVMGALGQQQRANGLDASGLANLLTSQKDNIRRAIPAGLAEPLSDTGLFDNVLGTSEVRDTSAPSKPVAPSPRYAPKESSSWSTGWFLPALVALVLAGAGWNFYLRPQPADIVIEGPPTADIRSTTGSVRDAKAVAPIPDLEILRGIKIGNLDYGAEVADTVAHVRATLAQITDDSTAKAASPELYASVDKLDKLAELRVLLSIENRHSLANAMAAARPSLDRLFDSALRVPRANELIQSPIDNIRAELNKLTTS